MVTEIPMWLKGMLDQEGLKRIEQAVKSAETNTSGEIVPLIVRGSSTIGHVPPLCFCIISIFFLVSGGHLYQLENWPGGSLWWLADLVFISLVAIVLSRSDIVKRQLTSSEDLESQVFSRAEIEFFEAKIGETQNATGVLIFLSLMEHRVVVLADEAIASRLDPSVWQEVVVLLLEGVKKGDLSAGFESAINECSKLLQDDFPVSDHDKNELKDHLIIKD